MTDFLDQKRQEITDRLAELKPLVNEFHRLEAAAAALVGVGNSSTSSRASSSTSATPRRGPGRPRRSSASSGATSAAPARAPRSRSTGGRRRPGRRKGSGTRSVQALSLVKEQPGITIPELAARMGIKQNYLYRVLPGLEQEGKVAKQGRGWHPKGS